MPCQRERLAQLDQELLSYFSRRVDSMEQARDLRQEVWLAATGYRGESSLGCFLFSVARRRLADHFRRKGRALLELPVERTLIHGGPGPGDFLEPRRVLEAITQVPEPFADVLRLHLAGYDGREVAAMTGCSPHTARSRLFRGREALRAVLGEDRA